MGKEREGRELTQKATDFVLAEAASRGINAALPYFVAGAGAVLTLIAGWLQSLPWAPTIFYATGTGLALMAFPVVWERLRVRAPDIRQVALRYRRSITSIGTNTPGIAFMARYMRLLNTGADTVLTEWRVQVTPPGGDTYTANLVPEEMWKGLLKEQCEAEHMGVPILAGGVLRLNHNDTTEATLILSVSGPDYTNLGVGTHTKVEAKDSAKGKWWTLYDTTTPYVGDTTPLAARTEALPHPRDES